ncbi:hypothetical protein AB0K89_05410 [Streptomyces cinnamoneus]
MRRAQHVAGSPTDDALGLLNVAAKKATLPASSPPPPQSSETAG